MPDLEAGKAGLTRVVDSTGQFNGHVSGEVLEVGVDVAAFGRDRQVSSTVTPVLKLDPPIGFYGWSAGVLS